MRAVFLLTIKEVIRRRILLVTLILAVVFLALFATGVHYGYKDMVAHAGPLKSLMAAQFLAMGLYFGSFIIAFLAIMAAVGSISGEIENGVIFAIVPRPVRRAEIILGKFLGYGLVLMAFAAFFYIAILVVIDWNTGISVPVRPGALGLFCLQPLVLLAVTLLGTTFLSTLANGVASFMLYSVGFVGGMLEQIGHLADSQVLANIGILSSLVMPVDSLYRKIVYNLLSTSEVSFSAYMLGPFGAGAEPSIWMLVYTVIYLLLFLVMAVRVFSRRDL